MSSILTRAGTTITSSPMSNAIFVQNSKKILRILSMTRVIGVAEDRIQLDIRRLRLRAACTRDGGQRETAVAFRISLGIQAAISTQIEKTRSGDCNSKGVMPEWDNAKGDSEEDDNAENES